MTMTDPVADMLTRLRNANRRTTTRCRCRTASSRRHIAEILQKEGYIAGWKVEDARVGKTLTIDLKYGPNRERSIAGIKRVSKPGLRVYAKSTEIPHGSRRPRRRHPVHLLRSADRPRRPSKKGVGGEVLAYVW